MAKNRYTFNVGEKTYAIWMWKGDYINLGAGAEAGIYEYAGLGHWFTATDMAMPMELSLTYKGCLLYTSLKNLSQYIDYYSGKQSFTALVSIGKRQICDIL